MQAIEPLRRFMEAARGAGVRISPAESFDAVRAVQLVGYHDRDVLKDVLAVVLAKSAEEKIALTECFDLYFARESLSSIKAEKEELPAAQQANGAVAGGNDTGGGSGAVLGRMMLENDAAGIAAAVEVAAEVVGTRNIRFFTQRNLYARRVLDRMGLHEVEQEIHLLRQGSAPDLGRARRLEAGLTLVREQVRDLVQHQLLLFARAETEALREEVLKSTRLSNLDRRDYERMRGLVRMMARKLAVRYAKPRRRRLRGQLDARRTLRRNMGWGGVPMITVWKQRRMEKPRLIVLCDVSGSVAAAAQFLLMFLYALSEALTDIRSFAFAGSLIDVSDVFEHKPIEQAIATVLHRIGFGSSNYGNSLAEFEAGWMATVTRKSTVIILGDARGNRTDPRVDILQRIATRAKRIIWLNPEYRAAWGTGDSDMYRYAPYCHLLRECATLRDLERVVTDLIELAR